MPYLARQLQDAIRKIVREEFDALMLKRNREDVTRQLYGNWNFNEVRFLRERRIEDEVEPWDYNFWFDRGSWGHRCYPNGRTVELRIDRHACPACGIERPDTAPERRDESLPEHTQPVGTIIDRGEDEHGVWWTVKLDDDHWFHHCVTFGRSIVTFGTRCHHCRMERS